MMRSRKRPRSRSRPLAPVERRRRCFIRSASWVPVMKRFAGQSVGGADAIVANFFEGGGQKILNLEEHEGALPLRPLLPPRLGSTCQFLMPPPRPRRRRFLFSSLLATRPALDLESLLSAPSTRVGLWHSRARSSLIKEQVPTFLCAGPLRSWSKSWHSRAR